MFRIQFSSLIVLSLGICLTFAVTASCSSEEKYPPGGPHYYKDWESYKIPYRPYNEITLEETKSLTSYYEAYFDEERKIISFKKYSNGVVEWSDKYFYGHDGNLEYREMTKANGEIQIQYFDKKGNIIRKDETGKK